LYLPLARLVLRPAYIEEMAQRDRFKACGGELSVYTSVIDGVPVMPKSLQYTSREYGSAAVQHVK
jgi:hypothetical protein